MTTPRIDELREIAQKAELAYREYGLGKSPDDEMFEARETFEAEFDPDVALALLDVVETARRLRERIVVKVPGGFMLLPGVESAELLADYDEAAAALDGVDSTGVRDDPEEKA
jgi:hypothetical protein